MKTIKQLLEQYDKITLKEDQWSSLVDLGLLAEEKHDLIKRAINIDPEVMTIAEKNAILDLLHSLTGYVLSETSKKQTIATQETDPTVANTINDKNIPLVLLLKRKAIRVYPDNQKVALYYSQALDKYVSIPFSNAGASSPVISESTKTKQYRHIPSTEKFKERKVSDAELESLPSGLRKQHAINQERDRKNQLKQDILSRTPNRELHKVEGGVGQATSRFNHQNIAVNAAGKAGIALNVWAKGIKQRRADSRQTRAQAQAQATAARQTELKKHTDNYIRTLKYGSDASPNKTSKIGDDASKAAVNTKKYYSDLANASKQKIKSLGGTIPKFKPTPRVVGPIATPRKGAVKPPALAENWFTDKAKGAINKVRKKFQNNTKGPSKNQQQQSPTSSQQTSATERPQPQSSPNYTGSQTTRPNVVDTFAKRISVDNHQIRATRAAYGSDPYGSQRNESTNLDVIRLIAENNTQKAEIDFDDKSIPINYAIAKKFMAIYESLNNQNKKKIESMLNENSTTCSKAINFAIRQ